MKICWEEAAGGTVYFPENMDYFVKPNDIDTYSKLMIRLSYFGKKATKEPSNVCKKRIGFGIRKVRKTGAMSAYTDKKLETQESELVQARITSYNVCYTKLLRSSQCQSLPVCRRMYFWPDWCNQGRQIQRR